MSFNQRSDISTLNGGSLKLVDKFTYLGSSVSSTKKDINMRLTKAWTVIDRLSVIWKSDLTNKIKFSFFQAAVVSILLYGCTTWMLTKHMEKELYGHQQPITKTIQVRWTRHVGHCWRSKDELISAILLWTPSHGQAKVGQLTRTDIQQLCADKGCSLEDLPGAMDDRDRWQERVREIHASSTLDDDDDDDEFLVIPWLPFFGEEEDASFSLLFCLYTALHNWRSESSTFLVFHTSRDILLRPATFLILMYSEMHLILPI